MKDYQQKMMGKTYKVYDNNNDENNKNNNDLAVSLHSFFTFENDILFKGNLNNLIHFHDIPLSNNLFASWKN